MSEREPGQLALDAFYQREGDKSIWEFTPAEQRLPWARVEVAIRADERAAQAARIAELERECQASMQTIADERRRAEARIAELEACFAVVQFERDAMLDMTKQLIAAEVRLAECERERDALIHDMEQAISGRNGEAARAERLEAALNEAANTLEDMSWSHNCGVLDQAAVRTRAALSANGEK